MKDAREKIYVCADVDLPQHRRVIACRDPAGCLGIWLAMTAYTREHLTNGFVPKKYALGLWADKRNRDRIADMIVNDLLAECGNEYEVLRYAPRNQTKEMVDEAKRKSRKRMADWRAAKSRSFSPSVTDHERITNGDGTAFVPSSSSSSSSSSISSDPDRNNQEVQIGARHGSVTGDGAMGMSVDCWCDGIRLETGHPCTRPTPGVTRALIEALVAHCPQGLDICEWARSKARAFARSRQGKTLSPHAFIDWLNSGSQPTVVQQQTVNRDPSRKHIVPLTRPTVAASSLPQDERSVATAGQTSSGTSGGASA